MMFIILIVLTIHVSTVCSRNVKDKTCLNITTTRTEERK